MINVYVELIKAGRRDLSSVPAFLRPDVEKALEPEATA
jgi:hypothetical protein